MIYYIYFTDNLVAAGEYESDNKDEASEQIHKMIREQTTEKYGCLISDKINFIDEVKNVDDVEAYISELIYKMGVVQDG